MIVRLNMFIPESLLSKGFDNGLRLKKLGIFTTICRCQRTPSACARLFFENLTNGKASYESLETRDPKINLIGFVLW